jgi:hypothetical protein
MPLQLSGVLSRGSFRLSGLQSRQINGFRYDPRLNHLRVQARLYRGANGILPALPGRLPGLQTISPANLQQLRGWVLAEQR